MPIERRIYLASKSPRRRELLKQIGVNFELLMLRSFPEARADVVEQPLPGEAPSDSARRLAHAKAETGWLRSAQRGLPRFPILSADTVVALDDEFIGKPRNTTEAGEILKRLSGRKHEVHTAVSVAYDDRIETLLSTSVVTFRELTAEEIRNYVSTGEPMDKAGAYGIQGRAATFVSHLDGSFSGVVGLPLYETAQLLRQYGISVL